MLAVVVLVILSPVTVFIVRKLLARSKQNPVPSHHYPLLAQDQQERIHMTSNIAYGVIPPQLSAHNGNVMSMTEDRVYSEDKDDCDDEYSYIPPTVSGRP